MEDHTSGVSTVPNRLSPLSTLFKSTWLAYRSHFVVLTKIMLIPLVSALIAYSVSTSSTLVSTTGFWPVFTVVILTLAHFSLQLLAYAALICCMKGNLGLFDSLRDALNRFLPFLAATLLAGVASLIGFALLVVPGVLATVWFSLAGYTLIFEERKAIAALRRSRALVKGYFFPVLLRLVVAWILVAAVGLLILLPVSLAGSIDPSSLSQGNLPAAVSRLRMLHALDFSLVHLVNVFATPVLVVFGVQIYRDLNGLKGESL